MRDKIAIIGAGGHGRVCAEIAQLCGYKTVVFLDDNAVGKSGVLGKTTELPKMIGEYDIFVGVGNNELRSSYIDTIHNLGVAPATLIHPKSCVSSGATIGAGSVIMASAVVNTGVVIGEGATVVSDINETGTYIGLPARKIK